MWKTNDNERYMLKKEETVEIIIMTFVCILHNVINIFSKANKDNNNNNDNNMQIRCDLA